MALVVFKLILTFYLSGSSPPFDYGYDIIGSYHKNFLLKPRQNVLYFSERYGLRISGRLPTYFEEHFTCV